MKVALYQGAGTPAGIDENLEVIKRKAIVAAEKGADLIIFPELFLSGYNIGETVRKLAEQADGPACRMAAQFAKDADIAILYGYPERLNSEIFVAYINRCGIEGDKIYCGRTCMVGPDGRDIIRAGKAEELLIADVNKQAVADARQTNPVLKDLRPELYRKSVTRG